MKTSSRFLILRHLILAAIFLAVGACTFKKNPVKPSPEIIVIEKTEALGTDPEFVISNKTEESFISSLDEKTILYLESIRSPSGETLIDLTVKLKKKKVLEYLLARGFNPLFYGTNSISELSKNAEYKQILTSFQKPHFYKLFTQMYQLIEDDRLDQELKKMNFQNPSCQDLVSLILDGYFYESVTSDSNDAITHLESFLVPSALKSIFSSATCGSLKHSISSSELNKWIGAELLKQVNDRFRSVELINFFLSLGDVENLSIDGYDSGRKVKVDPRLFTFLYGNVLVVEGDHRADWFRLLSKIVSKELHFYNYKYTTAHEYLLAEDPCDEFRDEYCLKKFDNEQILISVSNIFGLRVHDGEGQKNNEAQTESELKESNSETP